MIAKSLPALAFHLDLLDSGKVGLRCWHCGLLLVGDLLSEKGSSRPLTCTTCGTMVTMEDGIWRSLSPEALSRYSRFFHDYPLIREAEGRGSCDSSFYLALPFEDRSGRNVSQWKVRARSYKHLLRRVVRPMALKQSRPLNILDLGAGNGWLSYRLALLGHHPVAVDLLVNAKDGLAAAEHYFSQLPSLFPRVQAEAENLPFPSACFDLVIFNASFHYSADYVRTLQEALRCTNVGGAVVIADTPWYPAEQDGHSMVAEKRASFQKRYGFPSDTIGSMEFLTPPRLEHLAAACEVKWTVSKPFHGVRWALRPLIARLKRRRRPSRFLVHIARAKQ